MDGVTLVPRAILESDFSLLTPKASCVPTGSVGESPQPNKQSALTGSQSGAWEFIEKSTGIEAFTLTVWGIIERWCEGSPKNHLRNLSYNSSFHQRCQASAEPGRKRARPFASILRVF